MIEVALFSIGSILIPVLIASTIALFLGVIIVIVTKIFAIPVDERLENIKSILPGANCGACGYSGCEGYAEALAAGELDTAKCPVGGVEVTQELSKYLGVEVPEFIPKVAHVHCQGTLDHTQKRFDYRGTIGCAAAHSLFSGPNSCSYGCLGFGDCEAACQYHAIYMAQGIAHVDSNKCTACGLCVVTCPKKLIVVIPKHLNAYTVKCKNKWPGAQTRKNCSTGCIGCQICLKSCKFDAITMNGPLAVIDQKKCTRCGACELVCPTHAIANGLMLGPNAKGIPGHTGKVAIKL